MSLHSRVLTFSSHPLALQLCQLWLSKNLPSAQLIATSNAPEKAILDSEITESAFISSSLQHKDVQALAKNIQDSAGKLLVSFFVLMTL